MCLPENTVRADAEVLQYKPYPKLVILIVQTECART